MVIKIRDPLSDLAPQRIAAAIMAAVNRPPRDEAKSLEKPESIGVKWRQWGSVRTQTKENSRLD